MNRETLKTHTWIRRGVQISFYLFVLMLVLSHIFERQGWNLPWPVLRNFHAICPFGAVETAGRFIMEGSFLPKTHASNLWTFFGVVFVTITIGAAFCAYLCPLGSVQEWIGRLGKRIFNKKYNIIAGTKLDRVLGYMRYGVLLAILVQSTRMITLVFQKVDPYYALFHFWTGDLFIGGTVVLGVVLLLSLFVERPWCRWLCPFGALLGIVQLISPWKIRRNSELCNACGACARACPMGIDFAHKKVVLDTRCNRCGSCLTACRREGVITFSLPTKLMISLRNGLVTASLLMVLFATPILIAHAGGWYKTSNKAVVERGTLVMNELKGSMTLRDLATGFEMEMETVFSILGIPPQVPDSTKIYDLEEIDESITMHTVKTEFSKYLSKPDA
jgi:NAD-dependent dihydropyrimidine dehydrogenase PreA subunit